MGLKYSVVNFGCRVNQADALAIENELSAAGASPCSPDAADVVVVNTCSVTATADQGARQAIRRVARTNPAARILVTGCYATRQPDELATLPNVVRVVANDDKRRLLPLAGADLGLTTADRFGDGDGGCGLAIAPGVAGRTAFTLRVQTGCAEPCAYCIIPATRGAPRSVPPSAVLRDIEQAVGAGFREIVLTGVHLGSYGRDLGGATLVSLLRAIDAWATARLEAHGAAARVLFRISSLEPMDCPPDLVTLVAASDTFAPHFHLPLQHASNRMLETMRRPYTVEAYARLVEDIARRVPHAAIGSDVIVGFPGERDDDVDRLVAYLDGSPLTHVHVFPYSDRPGTAAATMRDKVEGAAVRARGLRVREIGSRLVSRFRAAQNGTSRPALTLEDGTLVVTDNYLKLRIAPGHARNEWVRVRVDGAGSAVVIEEPSPVAGPGTAASLRR